MYPKNSKCQKCGKEADLRPAGKTVDKLWICFDCNEAAEQNMHPTLGESAASESESKPAPKRVI